MNERDLNGKMCGTFVCLFSDKVYREGVCFEFNLTCLNGNL